MGDLKIPKIFHFIRISPMKFKIYHYLAIMSTYVINKPEKIYVYVDEEPQNNIYWESIKQYITIEKIIPPKIFRGVIIDPPQYQADIIRLEKLLERGGIYLDIDNLTLSSFENLLDNHFVMGGSPQKNTPENLENKDFFDKDCIDKMDAISNSIIMAIPNHPFIKEWYDKIHLYINDKYPWAYHAVCLPRDILKENKEYFETVKIMNWMKYFCPEGMWKDDPYIFKENEYINDNKQNKINELNNFYTLVFYQTLFQDKYLKKLDYFNVKYSNNIFSSIFSKYLRMMNNSEDDIIKLLWNNYLDHEWESLENNGIICEDIFKNDDNYNYYLSKFFVAYSQSAQKKFIESLNNFNTLIENNNVPDDIKIWSINNLKHLKFGNLSHSLVQ